MSIHIKHADYTGANGTYEADGAFRIRVFATNDEGAFDVWAMASLGRWSATWPATLPHDRVYTVRAELWRRADHAEVHVPGGPS